MSDKVENSDKLKNLGNVERFSRMLKIHELREEGQSAKQIADATNLSIQAIKRNFKYLDELNVADLTPEVRGKKRAELDLNSVEIYEQALEQYYALRDSKPLLARNYLLLAHEINESRKGTWGANAPKMDSVNFNQYNAYIQPEKVDREWANKYAEAKLKEHQKKLAEKE